MLVDTFLDCRKWAQWIHRAVTCFMIAVLMKTQQNLVIRVCASSANKIKLQTADSFQRTTIYFCNLTLVITSIDEELPIECNTT